MSLPRLAVLRPITTAMLLITVLVLGLIAFARMPLAFLPEVDAPFIAVQIPYPSSNPAQVEKEVTKPVEEVLLTIPGVQRLSSVSRADSAAVELEFTWGKDLDVVRSQVSEKIAQIERELPAGVGPIRIFSLSTNDMPVVEARISGEGVDLAGKHELLEARVVNRLRRVPGIARVDLLGVEPYEVSIDLVRDEITAHDVDIGRVIAQLRGASSSLVLGRIEEGGLRYTARSLGGFESLDSIADLVIDERGLRLGEVAEITYEEPLLEYGRHLDGSYAVGLEVFKESTANTVDAVNRVMAMIEGEIDADPLLRGINILVWQNKAEEITSGIDGLERAGMFGALLAILVLYFYLRRLDSTLIVSLSIPFSVVAACGVLYFMGKTLNILSMMGLMLGVGMLVDNAIVVLESIDRRHRDEADRSKAALQGANHVAMAVTASTVTSLIVFLPLIVGASTDLTTWLREMGIAIALALACSLFSSLTLIPLMAAHLLGRKKTRQNRIMEWLEERYVGALAWTLRHRAKTFGLLVAGLAVGLLPFPTGLVDTTIFSAHVNRLLFVRYEFEDYFYKGEAEAVVDQVEAVLYPRQQEWGLASVYSYFGANDAGTVLMLEDWTLDDEEIKALRAEIRDALPEIPGARVFFHEDADAGGSSTYFAVKLFGQDSVVLEELALEAERRLATVEGIEDIATPFDKGRREIRVAVDREKAARLGLTAQDVSDIFAFTLGGMRLPRFSAGEREVETWLALRREDRETVNDLQALQISADGGRPVLLGDIARFEIVERPEEIERENRKVRAAVNATYEGDDWDEAKGQIEGLMDAIAMPGGYSWGWNDRILEQQDQNQQMAVNFLLALILVYLVMASLFESLVQPFAILFSIPFALPGVAWMLVITDTPFNLMGQIGLLILMGVVVNNGIVLLDHLNRLRAQGHETETAILRAGRERMRAILMTASTTILGLVPLAVGGTRVGGLFYYPLALTIMGGLISSAVLTLLVLPFINLGVEGVAAWARRVWWASAPTRRWQGKPEAEPARR